MDGIEKLIQALEFIEARLNGLKIELVLAEREINNIKWQLANAAYGHITPREPDVPANMHVGQYDEE